ncbi:ABC transporter related protein [Pirellula staleyi DSM 6068]|uniref:ABC transporter related protein n=1 Tax=Pirellula staleyi (strain ATCC 27377 / DSM 6068 / ICPB 4128) TaxID=530564 RepID=D2R4I2_PIRSD|nr:ABC transporter ATP-binding protein [Pirellula staleyi]ADB15330.1 ABC transporter related protein [Pirellula staleyi DSM 6068]
MAGLLSSLRSDQKHANSTGKPNAAGAEKSTRIDQPTKSNAPAILRARGLHKSYRKGKIEVPVLRGVDLDLRKGELVSIVGQSGCGKTTLLHLLGTLDQPDQGEIHFAGERIDKLAPRLRDKLRNQKLGMIFQFYHLLPELSTLENVLTPIMISQGVFQYLRYRRAHQQRAKELLELVGLGHRLTHKPQELSGGEMQRTAIARALIQQPELLLADEPTGNLDRKTGEGILEILRTLNREQGLTIVMVTHDQAIAKAADRSVQLVEGVVDHG